LHAPPAQLSVKRLQLGGEGRVNEVRINPALRNFEQGFWNSKNSRAAGYRDDPEEEEPQ